MLGTDFSQTLSGSPLLKEGGSREHAGPSWVGPEKAWSKTDNDRCPLVQPVQIRAGQQPRFESWLHHVPTVTWAWHLTSCSPMPLKMKTKHYPPHGLVGGIE